MDVTNASNAMLVAQHELALNQQAQSRAMLRLSTAEKINSAADDAVSLVMGTKMRSDSTAMAEAAYNAADASGYANAAGDALGQAADLLMRAEELSIRAANDTLGEDERAMIDNELGSIKAQLNDLGAQTGPSGAPVFGHSFSVYTGSGGDGVETLDLEALDSDALGVADTSAATWDAARASAGAFGAALEHVLDRYGKVSTFAAGMKGQAEHLDARIIATEAARSRITDTDFARESAEVVSRQVRTSATITSMVHNQDTLNRFLSQLGG